MKLYSHPFKQCSVTIAYNITTKKMQLCQNKIAHESDADVCLRPTLSIKIEAQKMLSSLNWKQEATILS